MTNRLDEWEWLISTCEALLNKGERVEVTDKMIEKLEGHIERSRVFPDTFAEEHNLPEGLTSWIINGLRKKRISTVDPDHWAWLMKTYEGLPDQHSRIAVTKEMQQHLTDILAAHNVGIKYLLQNNPPPEGVHASKVNKLRAGELLTVEQDQWNWIIETLSEGLVNITPSIRERLHKERERTNVNELSIWKLIENRPKGLTLAKMREIFVDCKLAPEEWLETLFSLYEDMPTMVEMSSSITSKINAEVKRTGLGGAALFALIEDGPAALNRSKAKGLVSGAYQFVPEDILEAFFEAYARQPDQGVKPTTPLDGGMEP